MGEVQARFYDEALAVFRALEPQMESFIESISDAVIATGCRAVGCDITYEQRNAVLAVLKRIREKKPEIVTMVGGNSCTGDRGRALVDYAPWVDLVFSGEADDIIVPVFRMLAAGVSPEEINRVYPCVLVKGSVPGFHARAELESCAVPDFTDYFAELERTGLRGAVDPCLLIEASRGCWWGERRRCTFCGIHTCCETLVYRSKSPAKIAAELKLQRDRWGVNAFVFTACSLSRVLAAEPPGLLSERDGFHLFAEVKSNLTLRELRGLKCAGFVMVQPGIESLQDDLLRLMNKGNRGIRHIEFLKHARACGMHLIWHMLGIMPFDCPEYYRELAEFVPWLTHLQAPVSANNIIFQRSSTYTQHQADYGLRLQPVEVYNYLGDFGGEFVALTAEYFCDEAWTEQRLAKCGAAWEALAGQLLEWNRAFQAGDVLEAEDVGGRLLVTDLRARAERAVRVFDGVEREVLLASQDVVKLSALRRRLAHIPEPELTAAVAKLKELHYLVQYGDEIINLFVPRLGPTYNRETRFPAGRVITGDEG